MTIQDCFVIRADHVKERFAERFRSHAQNADRIVERLCATLRTHAPVDWRFTESPTSRFFIVDEESGAKFLGMSYRRGTETPAIVQEIQDQVHSPSRIYALMDDFVNRYISEVHNPALPIVHEIRTVYGKKSGEIGEEKRWYEQARETLYHVIPMASKKIASRPNAVICADGSLWVRQHLNWVSMNPGSPEYYLFQPLTCHGVDKQQAAIFSYTENGNLKKASQQGAPDSNPQPLPTPGEARSPIDPGMRSESYWRVPTYLDRRLIDLDYIERYSGSPGKDADADANINTADIIEFFFLKQIVHRAKKRIYCQK